VFARRFRTLFSAATAAVVLAGTAVLAPLTADAAITAVLSGIQYDPPGADVRTNAQINNEFFTVRNISTRPINLSGFRVADVAYHVFVFPRGYVNRSGEMMMGGGASVTDPPFPRRSKLIDYVLGLGSRAGMGSHPAASDTTTALTPQEQRLFNLWVLLGAQYRNR